MARTPTPMTHSTQWLNRKDDRFWKPWAEELSVNEIVERLGWNQPMVSKHLGVLKQVGLVSERRVGRQRLYRVNAEQLKPIL